MNVMIAANYAAPKSGNFVASMIALGRKLKGNGIPVVFVFPVEKEWVSWFKNEGLNVEIVKDRYEQGKFRSLTELVSN